MFEHLYSYFDYLDSWLSQLLSPVPTSPHNWGSTVIISLFSLHACWIMYICSLEKLLTNQLLAVTKSVSQSLSSSWLVRRWFKVFKTNHRSIVEKPNHFLIYFGHSIKHFYFIYTVEETLMLDPKKYSQTSISRTTITWIFQIFRLAYLVPLCLNIYIHILIIWTLDYPNF